MKDTQKTEIEAAVLRRLLDHLAMRTDAQNIDLMGLAGFCRNCLGNWYAEAAAAQGIEMDKETAREAVYGMPYAAFKEKYQTPATDEQMAKMDASVALNKKLRAGD